MKEKIRLYYILPLDSGLESWGEHTRQLMEAITGPGVGITLVDLPGAPVKTIMSTYHSDLVTPLCIAEAIKAERDGYDAVGVGCLLEPGITAMKEILDIPVVGDAEAAMHFASFVGRRFTFLLPGSRAGRLLGSDTAAGIEDLARKYGFVQKLASIRSVPAQSLDFASKRTGLPEAMLDQAQKAVEQDGADSIISYPTMDILCHLQENLQVPVIDPVQAFTMMAVSLVRLKVAQSKRAFPKPYEFRKDSE